jgi:hypothetical protein
MASNTSDFFTFSKTAGTAKNLQKPTDGGDNNLWGAFINVDLDTIVGAVNATSDLIADANQNELVDFTATGSAVNHVGITNAATGNGPTIEAAGDDSNVDLNVKPKGTGAILLKDGDGNELVKTSRTASAVNEITVANAATGNGPTLSATGDDTNIDLNIAGKGTGDPKMVDLKVTNIKANDGTSGISIADSTGRLTVTESNPVIELGSNTTFPAGIVIGFEFMSSSSYVTRSANTYTATPLTDTIQVKQSGSKILAFFSVQGVNVSAGANAAAGFQIVESVTSLSSDLSNHYGSIVQFSGNFVTAFEHTHGQSEGTILTYTLNFRQFNNNQTVRINDHMAGTTTTSCMYLMEIA